MDDIQRAAFEAFVASSGDRLLRAAFLLTGDRHHAEDLVQTTLERVAARWRRLDGAPEAYARVVLSRLATDRWRSLSRRPAETALEDAPAPLDRRSGHESLILDRQVLVEALRRLPRRQRTVLVLRHVLDLSEAETAASLGISLGAVKSAGSRGAARLRAHLGEPDPPGPTPTTSTASPSRALQELL